MVQMFTYGRGRTDQSFRDPSSFRLFHLLPPMFCLYAIMLPFWIGRWPWGIPAFIYLGLNLFFSCYLALLHWNAAMLPWLPLLFFCVHVFYGAGMLYGAAKHLLERGGVPRRRPAAHCAIDHVIRF